MNGYATLIEKMSKVETIQEIKKMAMDLYYNNWYLNFVDWFKIKETLLSIMRG